MEPLLYEFAWAARSGPTSEPAEGNPSTTKPKSPKGWHGELRGDIAAYADGHASILKEVTVAAVNGELEARLGPSNAKLLLRGSMWSLDTYPSSATAILGEWPGTDGALTLWPDLKPDQWPVAGLRALPKKRP